MAAQAGTSAALVIYYFKTRDQLLTEAIRFSEDAWRRTDEAGRALLFAAFYSPTLRWRSEAALRPSGLCQPDVQRG